MGRKRDIRKELVEQTGDESLLFADGFDDAIIGLEYGTNRVVYDQDKIMNVLLQSMGPTDAFEYFDFNIACAYVGERTPIYINKKRRTIDPS